MLKFIIGTKGTGKTNKLIEMVNEAVKVDKGHIVFINNDSKRHIFDIDYKIRLIDTQNYDMASYQTLYGMICGVLSQDYDISNIFVDSITKVVTGEDINSAEKAINDIAELCEKSNVNLVVTASIAEADAPEFIKKYL